ncbi:MAG: serine protease [Aureliella sp.]
MNLKTRQFRFPHPHYMKVARGSAARASDRHFGYPAKARHPRAHKTTLQPTILRLVAFLTFSFALIIAVVPAAADETVLVERGQERWRHWNKGEHPPKTWNTVEFDDSAWGKGSAPLGYGVDGIATKIGFGEDGKNKPAAAFFRLTFDVNDPAAHPVWIGALRCDDGAAVYLNGKEIYRYNMPEGDLAKATFAAGTVSRFSKSNYHTFYLDPVHLKAGQNVLAISVHQANAASSDLVMDFALKGRGRVGDPETKPLHSGGVLKPDDVISDYINRWGKHLLSQDRGPNYSILSRLTDRLTKTNRLNSELNRTLDRKVDLVEPSDIPLTAAELLESCAPGVLIISGIMESNSFPPAHASGFVISEDGLALTNHHVMQALGRGDLVVATSLNGRVVRVREIVAANEADDVALIQLDGEGFHPLPIAESARVGADLVAISHPSNAFFSATDGLLARRTRVNGRHRIMVTTEFALGSSGAPILDRFGSVVGLVERTQSVAKKTVPVHTDKNALKLGKGEGDRGLFLYMDHEMTLRYAVPCESLRAFLNTPRESATKR